MDTRTGRFTGIGRRRKRCDRPNRDSRAPRADRFTASGRNRSCQDLELHILRNLDRWGRFLLETGRHAEAEPSLARSVSLDGSVAENWADLGSARVHLGRLGPAAEALREACRLDSSQVIPFYNLGEVLVRLGEIAEARGDTAAAHACWREARMLYAHVESRTPDLRGTRARLAQLRRRLP